MWQIKEMIALVMLAVCAYTDIKERSIYVFPLAVSVTGTVAISIVSFICSPVDKETEILLYDILLPAITGVILIIAVRAAKSHIGMGDGYLMASLGLMTGLKTLAYMILVAFVLAAIYGFIKSVFRKRRFVRSIPFAPFVLTGFVAVLINEI